MTSVDSFLGGASAPPEEPVPGASATSTSSEASAPGNPAAPGTGTDSDAAPRAEATPNESGASAEGDEASSGAADEPLQFFNITPSGIEAMYQAKPKRLYRLRQAYISNGQTVRAEDLDWVEVPSVTTILGCLDKPALPWWGMKVGVEGTLKLAHEYGLLVPAIYTTDGVETRLLSLPNCGALTPATVESVISFLTEKKLTVNHVRDQAGDRGNSVHQALEDWAKDGVTPHPELYPETERGYVAGLCAFLRAVDGAIEVEGVEVMVGSLEHRFAGRYDLRVRFTKSVELVTRIYPKKADKVETFEAGSYLPDLKTSAGVYETHFMQLEAYEGASIECGYGPTDDRFVIRVTNDGRYECQLSTATFEDFLAVLGAQRALERVKSGRRVRK